MANRWTYSSMTGYTRTSSLTLSWEMNGDPISDNFTPDDIDAVSLLKLWIERYFPDSVGEQLYGPGMVSIEWYVDGTDAGTFEGAPFTTHTLARIFRVMPCRSCGRLLVPS